MNSEEIKHRLFGIIPPLVTPFNEDGEVNYELFRKEVRRMIATGVSGLSVGGSTGEGETLSEDELQQMSEIAVKEAKGKIIVIGGIITDSTVQAVRKGLKLKETGVDVLMITPIHYLFSSGDEGIYAFYKEIYQATGMPIIVYNVVPWYVASPEILQILGSEGIIVGVKQSGGDIHSLGALLVESKTIMPIITAIDDMLFPSFILGAQGAICAINTLLPKTSIRLFKAIKNQDIDTSLSLHDAILPICRSILQSDMPSRIKFAMNRAGWEVGYPRKPLLEPVDTLANELTRLSNEVVKLEEEAEYHE
jgi:4-hydroxy-tetrahydrodipicolinate synthase